MKHGKLPLSPLRCGMLLLMLGHASLHAATNIGSQPLHRGWKLQSSCIAQAQGEEISLLSYHPQGWIPAVVPGTVLGSQVAAGIFRDPFFGMNLRQIPGMDYPIAKVFGYLPMSENSPYRCSWWYRNEFQVEARKGRTYWLHFNGINYRANLWINGKRIAKSDSIAGAFRDYDFDITESLNPNGHNVLAVEVFAQTEKVLGIDFLDWNPAPADKSMGLWRDVSLKTTGLVRISNPAVLTHFPKPDLTQADLTLVADLHNSADHPVTIQLAAQLGMATVKQQVTLTQHESRAITFSPEVYLQLRWQNPKIWWPYQYGEPHLETMHVTAMVDQEESDTATTQFGIREVQSSLNQQGALQFRINHQDILIRGGGWAPDLFYREPRERLEQELAYVKHMHLNAIRLEGKLGDDAMFGLADEMGILILAGWQCCDAWQHWDKWTAEDHQIAAASTYTQVSRLRAHPSVLVWLNGSDEAPPPTVEKEALDVLHERQWPNPILSAAADRTSPLTGKSGVKMLGPYDYVPPEYWYLDKDRFGGAFGFNTEAGPGPAIPTVESIQRTLPRVSWWSGQSSDAENQDEQWRYHAGLGKFAQYQTFNSAMNATYGAATSLEQYDLKAQLMAYDGERAMFEAYGANKYHATGVIQWMLNNAWPSFIWHLYDYYLVPGGGYFATRKANEPVHIQYRYDDRRVVVVNSTLVNLGGLSAAAQLFDLKGQRIFSQSSTLAVSGDSVFEAFPIPSQNTTTFLKLQLLDSSGRLLSDNFYWIPSKLSQLDWDKTTYVTTPAVSYADMRDLSTLEPARVELTELVKRPSSAITVKVNNTGKSLAFFLYLRAVKVGTNEDVAPIFWDDNAISLLPGEKRILTISGLPKNTEALDIQLTGWNVESVSIPVHVERH